MNNSISPSANIDPTEALALAGESLRIDKVGEDRVKILIPQGGGLREEAVGVAEASSYLVHCALEYMHGPENVPLKLDPTLFPGESCLDAVKRLSRVIDQHSSA